jgi:hypothetical protein
MVAIDNFNPSSIEKLIQQIKPEIVEGYISTKNTFFSDYRDDITSIYRNRDNRNLQIKIPLHPEFPDYSSLLLGVIKTVAAIENRNVWEIITNLRTDHPSDILRYQLKGSDTEDGTAPLKSGANLYSGALDTLKASAFSVEYPEKLKFSRSKNVLDLVDLCRIGQTEYGSYSVPLICPLFTKDSDNLVKYIQWSEDPEPTFTRKVTINLMKSLNQIVDFISKDENERLINPSSTDVKINPKMYEALTEMGPKSKNLNLNISSDWLIIPPAAEVPKTISVENDYFRDIKEISDALSPEEESDIRDFVGVVHLLKDDLKPRRTIIKNQVGISTATPGGEMIYAKMILNEENYRKASSAHAQKKAVTIKGVLKKLKRDYHIIDIENFQVNE